MRCGPNRAYARRESSLPKIDPFSSQAAHRRSPVAVGSPVVMTSPTAAMSGTGAVSASLPVGALLAIKSNQSHQMKSILFLLLILHIDILYCFSWILRPLLGCRALEARRVARSQTGRHAGTACCGPGSRSHLRSGLNLKSKVLRHSSHMQYCQYLGLFFLLLFVFFFSLFVCLFVIENYIRMICSAC